MKTIAFIANGKSFLPELDAYSHFFQSIGWKVSIFRQTPKLKDLKPFGVEWHIMGTDLLPKVMGRIKIHEYCSVSTPPLPKIKNRLKKIINVSPDYRVFQSKWVFNEMRMYNKPYILRDMGISESFFILNSGEKIKKEYDFVYAGSFEKQRKIEKLVVTFLANFKEENLLLIGNIPNWLKKNPSKQLVLKDSIPYYDMSTWIQKANYGINYVPDIYPFNHQTSTKILEYCACGLKIITTFYNWGNEFENRLGGEFFKIDENGKNFHPDIIDKFQFVTPDVKLFSWENQFSTSEFKKLLDWLN